MLNPSIGQHCYTAEEFFREFDEEERAEYFAGGNGRYGVQCDRCKGEKVIDAVDWDVLKAENPELAKRYRKHLREEREFAAIQAAERAMGA